MSNLPLSLSWAPDSFSCHCFRSVVSPMLLKCTKCGIETGSHWVWKAPLEISATTLQHKGRVERGRFLSVLNISKDGDSTPFVVNLCQCLITLTMKNLFSYIYVESFVFQIVLLVSCPVTKALLTRVQLYYRLLSLNPPVKYFYKCIRSSWAFSSPW